MLRIYNLKNFKEDKGKEFSKDIEDKVLKILNSVKKKGDKALIDFTSKFDKIRLKKIKIENKKIKNSLKKIHPRYIKFIRKAIKKVYKYHLPQKERGWFERNLGTRILPLEKIGIYVPGGRAFYPSTLIMCAVPAQIAGVEKIIVCSPPPVNDHLLAAAKILNIKNIYQVGGAQAIAAMAYGTKTIPRVDKIVGPGNIFVAVAKKLVFGDVAIDSIAGPSDVVVIADESADPTYVAIDLISQAEHGSESEAILVTPSLKIANAVNKEIDRLAVTLNRRGIIRKALRNRGAIIKVKNLSEGIEITNKIAPEHLIIQTKNPKKISDKIKNAGAIFLGKFSPVSVGDYFAGPNHVLPTMGTARFSSPLGVYDFVKRQSIISFSAKDLEEHLPLVDFFACLEGLEAHQEAARIRFSSGNL